MTPNAPLSRRRLLGSALSATLLPLAAGAQSPPAKSSNARDGFRILEAREGKLQLLPDPAPATMVEGYDGTAPGSLLRYRKGDEVKVRLVNRLDQPTTLSWHGVRIANAMDGVAGLTQAGVPPGGAFDYSFTPPDSGLYWHHPHALPWSEEQIARGLYGVLIVDEPEPPASDHDMLVVIDDFSLNAGAQIVAPGAAEQKSAPLLTLNAQPAPATLTLAPRSRLRLRILSVVGNRVMQIAFEGAKPVVIAIDGQPCEAFEPARRTIPVGPGARFDILLDLPAEAGVEAGLILRGDFAALPLVRFKTAGASAPERAPIASLPRNPLLPTAIRLELARKFDILLDATAAPAKAPAPRRPPLVRLGAAAGGFAQKPLFSVKRGEAVSLGLINPAPFVQQVHVHGHHMRLLHDLDDGWEPYWRDSVLIPEGKTKHVAFIADNPGKWVIETLLAPPPSGLLAGWFEVA